MAASFEEYDQAECYMVGNMPVLMHTYLYTTKLKGLDLDYERVCLCVAGCNMPLTSSRYSQIQRSFLRSFRYFVSPCTPSEGFFYTSTKSWRGYIFTAVCLCVCLSVCVCVCLSVCVSEILVNKIPAERMHRFGRGFHLMVAYRTDLNPIENGELESKVKVTVT